MTVRASRAMARALPYWQVWPRLGKDREEKGSFGKRRPPEPRELPLETGTIRKNREPSRRFRSSGLLAVLACIYVTWEALGAKGQTRFLFRQNPEGSGMSRTDPETVPRRAIRTAAARSRPLLDHLQDGPRQIDPAPGAAGHLLEKALTLEQPNSLPGGGIGNPQDLDRSRGSEVGIDEQIVQEPQRVGLPAQPFPVDLPQVHEPARLPDGRACGLLYSDQEEAEPAGPVAVRPHPLEAIVILLAVSLDVIG